MADDTGTITFYEFFDPPLESGQYDVVVQQHVKGTQKDEQGNDTPFEDTFENRFGFLVQGVRFSLPPADLFTLFPAAGAQGEFSNTLPHVVFTARTLPWQRTSGFTSGTNVSPWLALLTFDELDPIPPLVVEGRLSDLTNPPQGTISYPQLTLEPGQKESDPVVYADVPGELFTAIAPKGSELGWLAHARLIDAAAVARKAFVEGQPAGTEYSAVIANRLPRPGSKTACYLVSLEEMARYLPDGSEPPGAGTNVRLAVLASWTFGSIELGRTFAEYLAALDRDPATPQIPYSKPADDGADAKQKELAATVEKALAMSYTAFPHQTRQGAQTISWYRGPLLPYANPLDVQVPIPSADALVRYDPDHGMFDVSLAAAWQLGRLLALADKDFATLVYNWKRLQQAQTIVDFERQFLAQQLGLADTLAIDDGRPLHMQMMERVFKPLLAEFLAKEGQ